MPSSKILARRRVGPYEISLADYDHEDLLLLVRFLGEAGSYGRDEAVTLPLEVSSIATARAWFQNLTEQEVIESLASEGYDRRTARSKSNAGRATGRASGPSEHALAVLDKELGRHGGQPLFEFEASSMPAMRALLDAGYLAPAAGHPKGYWVLTAPAVRALDAWRVKQPGHGRRAPHRGSYVTTLAHERSPGRDGGATVIIGVAVIVGALLLLRPLFKDSFERHKWSMEHDPAYRRSNEAMQYAEGARGVVDILGGIGTRASGRAAGRKTKKGPATAPRAHVIAVLERHFETYPRYYASVDREKVLLVGIELLGMGASATDAIAIAHGFAHDKAAQRKTSKSSPKATAAAIYSGRVRVRPDMA